MSILVFVEGSEGNIKKSSKEAISYAAEAGKIIGDKHIVVAALGSFDGGELKKLGNNGATKVVHVNDEKLNENQVGIYGAILSKLVQSQSAKLVVMTKSSFSDVVGGIIAGKTGASIVSNVVSLPDVTAGFTLRKSIFTGKAFANISLNNDLKVLIIKRNSVELTEGGAEADVEQMEIPDGIELKETITGNQKAEGDILLDDAEIVVYTPKKNS